MSKVLVLYGTTEGQSARVAEFIMNVLREHGHQVETVNVKESPDTAVDDFDGVIIGASIHMGKHDKHVVEFVQENRETLKRVPSAFYSVSLAAHGDTDEAEDYVEQFEKQTRWHPAKVALFGGALLYTIPSTGSSNAT